MSWQILLTLALVCLFIVVATALRISVLSREHKAIYDVHAEFVQFHLEWRIFALINLLAVIFMAAFAVVGGIFYVWSGN